MTTTDAPPPSGSSVEDIPGVTRRHHLADLYHERTNFQFIKHSRRWAILSGTLMVLSILLLVVRGLNFGIEFKGGTSWDVTAQGGRDPKVAEVRDIVEPLGFSDAKVSVLSSTSDDKKSIRVEARVVDDPVDKVEQALGDYVDQPRASVDFAQDGAGGTFSVTAPEGFTPTKEGATAAIAVAGLENPEVTVDGRTVTVKTTSLPESPVLGVAAALAKYANTTQQDVSISTVGPTWGREVSEKALKALIIFFLLLAAYLSLRFEWKMAAAAIVAVIHDIIFTLGLYALFQFQVSPATVTAFLTILGFSLYDTVVVFDKVGEFQRSMTATGRVTYGEMVNRALNAVLMRSLSTSLVALLPVMSLLIVGSVIMGATALEDFALALAAGLFIGSYSSIFVAAPLLAWWKEKEPRYKLLRERQARVSVAATSASLGIPAVPIEDFEPVDDRPIGVPGPPAVPRTPIQPRARQQRRRKRK